VAKQKMKTVIFDMDVIVDTEPVHRYAYFQHFEELNIKVTEEMFTSFTGNSTRNVFQNLKTIFNLDQVEDLIQRKRTIFNNALILKLI
jgi:beta-phosphoglucomutase-like phosphatase (HAD superfamily)